MPVKPSAVFMYESVVVAVAAAAVVVVVVMCLGCSGGWIDRQVYRMSERSHVVL